MRLAHISDLHLGKKLDRYPLIEDQRHILRQIVDIAVGQKCDGILIAGDIYDKSMPSAESVKLLDDFLYDLTNAGLPAYIISGNHDSAERVNYGSGILARAGLYISADFDGRLSLCKAEDEYGEVDIYMLPFIKPAHVRKKYPDAQINDYTDMMRTVIENSGVDFSKRCILMCHQFITGASTCDSEYLSVGTLDNIDAKVLEGFDYVALGHIHSPQNVGNNIRYCGTPLKYSSSESEHIKSVTLIDLCEKGNVNVSTVPLVPLHDLRCLRGNFDELISKEFTDKLDPDDYYYITLTDDRDIPNVLRQLRAVYKNFVSMKFDNSRTRAAANVKREVQADKKTPFELMESLYLQQNGMEMTDEQADYIKGLIDSIWEDEQ